MKRGSKQPEETKAKISKAKTKDGQTAMWDFLTFAIFYISRAKGSTRNPIMAEIVREFVNSQPKGAKPRELSLTGSYSVEMRKSLELHGYIAYASLNTVDRRIRFVSPTMLFPDSRCTKKLKGIIKEVAEDIRKYHRNKESKRGKK